MEQIDGIWWFVDPHGHLFLSTSSNGLGGFAIAAAPAIVQFVGGCAADAVSYTLAMYEITAGENNVYQIPYLDFRGTPTGIDVIKAALETCETVVLLKVKPLFPAILELLRATGKEERTVFVERVGSSRQKVLTDFSDIAAHSPDYLSLMIIK